MNKWIRASIIVLFLPLIIIIGFLNVLSVSFSAALFALTGDINKAKNCIEELSNLWEVKNGIIIDGVLHEGLNEVVSCEECTICELCDEYSFSLCAVFCTGGFVNRGKVKVEKEETE